MFCCWPAGRRRRRRKRSTFWGLRGRGLGDDFYPTAAAIISLNSEEQTIKVVNFCMQTQITAVTRQAGEMFVPLNFLRFCDVDEIVGAFETTFGIMIDRYLIYRREYDDYKTFFDLYSLFSPMTLDIPETIIGDEAYSPINEYLGLIAGSLGVDYAPIERAGTQELDAMKAISYVSAYPAIDWENMDWIAGTMEDYAIWDSKVRAVLGAVKPMVAHMDSGWLSTFCTLATDGQETNITADDIAAWSGIPFVFAEEAYLTVPGFEGSEVREFDSTALTDPGLFGVRIMVYDTEAAAASIREYIAGQ